MRQEDERRAGGEDEEEKGERYGNGGSMMHENLLGDCGGYGDRKAPRPYPEQMIWCGKKQQLHISMKWKRAVIHNVWLEDIRQ